jgi:hypothetical protein
LGFRLFPQFEIFQRDTPAFARELAMRPPFYLSTLSSHERTFVRRLHVGVIGFYAALLALGILAVGVNLPHSGSAHAGDGVMAQAQVR